MSGIFEGDEFADNPEPRALCVLVLDSSGSMQGAPIAELNAGLRRFRDDLAANPLAAKRVEPAVVTFGGGVRVAQMPTVVENFTPPALQASGNTPMGQAIQTALALIKARKEEYRANGVSYYRPWLFLFSDGEPNDEWQAAAEQLAQEEAAKGVIVFAVGVDGANFDVLRQVARKNAPVRLKDVGHFAEMFRWLSNSLQQVSSSRVGDQLRLEPPKDWGVIDT
ncbi:von Willebrand factor type A domain protein [Calidithermus terrae]|uniref:von Willebrand factor type A domain protein n=1 Tax=Calidithermus terrae TaxID=1408545 RepID=A0A399DS47_9DEIN|nr:VWA domain-containing protein [Calidithermus terrae]RIH75055.1 von Willebrand factor type A domain protein [Calidithermus terrae]